MDYDEAFTLEQVYHLANAVGELNEEGEVELYQLFQIALAFDDGHQLQILNFKSLWYYKNAIPAYESADNIYTTKNYIFTININNAKKYSKALCKALASNDIETASKHLCEYISKKLYKIFEVDLREKLIKQVAKDLPQQSSMIFEALDNNEIELY